MSVIARFQPMHLARRSRPFNHLDWIYGVKFDGFRALAYVEDGACRLVSRRRHEHKSFGMLTAAIAELPVKNAVIDGEIVCWVKIKSPAYSQGIGREELFQRS